MNYSLSAAQCSSCLLKKILGNCSFKLALIPLFILSACGFNQSQYPTGKESFREETGLSSNSREIPLKLEIVDQVNDGDKIYIMAKLQALANWPLDQLVVRLTGMNNGQIVDSADFWPKQKLAPQRSQLKVGEPIEFPMQIKSEGVSDYQLELLWGKDSYRYRQAKVDHADQQVALVNQKLEYRLLNCGATTCPGNFTVFADIENKASKTVSAVTLGVGMIWLESGQVYNSELHKPEDEERIEVAHLDLSPGQRRSIKIQLDREVPSISGGRVQPVLRLVALQYQ